MEENLMAEIEYYDTISFDIFDTLIMRRTLYPHDIFLIVEQRAKREGMQIPSFYENRICAEINLIAEMPNIYELYIEFQRITGISDTERDRLLQIELETEHSQLMRRDKVCSILEIAYERNNNIYLVSDMYIPKDILANWLAEFGITQFKDIFISCEYHKPKVNGLFDIYKKKTGGNRYLHVGDNAIYDGKYAKIAGINSFIIKSAAALVEENSVFAIKPYTENKEDRTVLGLLAAGLYNNPFVVSPSKPMRVERIQEMVRFIAAPMISGLVMWLIEQLKKEKYDGLLLAARDGYLIQKMLEMYEKSEGEKLPFYTYFYTSRIACTTAVIEGEADFKQAVRRPVEIPLEKCIEERMEIKAMSGNIDEIYMKNKEKIIAKSSELKNRYLIYASKLKHVPEGKYAFFDFVSIGTCLSLLNKIFQINMTGLFCYRYYYEGQENINSDLNIKSFLDDKQGKQFWKYYKIFETILTSLDGTFLRFNLDGKPIFAEDMRSIQEKELTIDMQNQVLKYWQHYLESGVRTFPSRELLIQLLDYFDNEDILISDNKKDILYLYDSFEGGKIKVFL